MLVEGDKGWTWFHSKSKKKLLKMIHRGEIAYDIKPKDVYVIMHPWFAKEVRYENWASRLRSCREYIKGAHKEAMEEARGLAHDRHIFPTTTNNTNGKAHWNGSAAEQIVRNAVLGLFHDVVIDDGIVCKGYDGSAMPSTAVRALIAANPPLLGLDFWDVYHHATQEIKRVKYFNYRALKVTMVQKKKAKKPKSASNKHLLTTL